MRCSTSRRWVCRSTARPKARSTSVDSVATHATTARHPSARACYAADRTGHMILQTLYQNCVKHDVEFFNEFYALDIAITETEDGPVATGVICYELSTGELHIFHAKSIVLRDRRLGTHVQDDVQRAHPHR